MLDMGFEPQIRKIIEQIRVRINLLGYSFISLLFALYPISNILVIIINYVRIVCFSVFSDLNAHAVLKSLKVTYTLCQSVQFNTVNMHKKLSIPCHFTGFL